MTHPRHNPNADLTDWKAGPENVNKKWHRPALPVGVPVGVITELPPVVQYGVLFPAIGADGTAGSGEGIGMMGALDASSSFPPVVFGFGFGISLGGVLPAPGPGTGPGITAGGAAGGRPGVAQGAAQPLAQLSSQQSDFR
jgi:hypothetical protein